MRLFCWHLMARLVKVEIDKRFILKTESNFVDQNEKSWT